MLQPVMELGSNNSMHDKNQQDVTASRSPISTEQRNPSSSVEINMEVPVTADEVMKAGGFGATDDIGTILPAASDFTDVEDHFLDARGYEESDDKTSEGQSDFPKIKFVAGKADSEETDNVEGGNDAVNMESYATSDDVMRAGGFGATDNISSFLPVASDFTDFEGALRDARAYEECEEKNNRHGLGWRNEAK